MFVFSENLRWFVFLLPSFLDSLFCFITDKNSLIVDPFPEMYINNSISIIAIATCLSLQLILTPELLNGTLSILMSLYLKLCETYQL